MVRRGRTWLALGAIFVGLLMGTGLTWLSLAEAARADVASSLPGQTAARRGLGPTDARVQIVLYFDFQCSHCDSLQRGAEKEIVRQYVATGKAHLEVRALPFMGPESQRAAEAAACAADQGRYFEYRDALFTAWRRNGPTAYLPARLMDVAGQLGLRREAFSSCLADGTQRAAVEADLRQARLEGVKAVPTMFINGQKIEGALPFQTYVSVIEEALAK